MTNLDRVRAQVRRWRDDLINLSRRNRVLYYRPTPAASLLIERPDLDLVVKTLLNRGSWEFYLPPDLPQPKPGEKRVDPLEVQPPRPSELVTHRSDARKVENALRTLERRAIQEAMDKGIWILYLAAGFVQWIDSEIETRVRSPLVLIPVKLDRANPRDRHHLVFANEEPVVNPALAVKLETDFGITLPSLGEVDELDVGAYLDEVRRNVVVEGWSVQPQMAVDVFSFHKEVMYKDLKDNEDLICDSVLIQTLALGADADTDLGFDPPTEDELDETHPPEKLATILDADASQRRCMVAARQGHSFVMDGPPGTGKSQTIANIIAQAIRDGKTVLFVSEKIAALEVVKARLDDKGLGDYLLELHSHKATRKEVARALYESLRKHPQPLPRMSPAELHKLASHRSELSAYAEAMNETRQPLQRSLHQAIGRVLQLDWAPDVPVPNSIDQRLELDKFQAILDVAEDLARAWAPVSLGEDFFWCGVDPHAATFAGKRAVLGNLAEAKAKLEDLRRVAKAVAEHLELWWNDSPRNALRLVEVLRILQARRSVPAEWLSREAVEPIEARVRELEGAIRDRQDAVRQLVELVGNDWPAIDAGAYRRVFDSEVSLTEKAGLQLVGDLDAASLSERSAFYGNAPEVLGRIEAMAWELANGLGLQPGAMTLDVVDRLVTLADLIGAKHRPEGDWLDTFALPKLDEAINVLSAVVDSYREKAEALSGLFKPSVLELDLESLRARFETLHRGIRKLGGAYRADKRELAAHTLLGKTTKAVIENLPQAIEWQQLAKELKAAEDQHSAQLGSYYRGVETAFDAVVDAIDVAREALNLAGRELRRPDVLRNQLALGGEPDPDLKALAEELKNIKNDFVASAQQLVPSAQSVLSLPIDEAASWFRECAPHIRVLATEAARLEELAGRTMHLRAVRAALEARAKAHEVDQALSSNWEQDKALLGEAYIGINTDWERITSDLEWVKKLRNAIDAPVDPITAQCLLSCEMAPEPLQDAAKSWTAARDAVLDHFERDRAGELVQVLESSFLDSEELLGRMTDTIGQIDDWVAFSRARNRLAELGLGEASEHLIHLRVDAQEVVPAIERAVLAAWVDSVMESDARLTKYRSDDRDALVEEFKNLDEKFIDRAAGVVMEAANHRRPKTNRGAAGIIEREGQKKRRHMPVRELIAATAEVVQAIKPCFMMSPLSVSQFIPPGLRFDMVVIDEASQVKPADAANCIYRGRQLIVAGDQQQLPPTTFFEAVSMDGGDEYEEGQIDEFESVLDLAKAGGIESLPLRWHYRSQHEALITYSNYSFYDGRLITFPGALDEAEDVGIEFFYVNGIYRRGGARDNPIEAEKVAERVLFHAERHPDLSLGVVAFSEAQAATIEYVLDQKRRERPDLDRFFSEGRLSGFFVKNLENVQGDERDIMIFSIGYGPDEMGKITMNFGPLNKEGGHRRLNVAITRARRRVEVVSSLRASDFQPTNSMGVRHLHRYLEFAERGMSALALDISDDRRDAESPFEEEVLRLVTSWGFLAQPQVGVADYRIDIGVRDPARPGRYILGIECDGAMYHSSKVARDRDRLRQQVLERLGWQIYRIWGTAWYRNRANEAARLREAIESAMRGEYHKSRRNPATKIEVQYEELDFEQPPGWAQEYVVCKPRARSFYSMTDPAARRYLEEGIEQIVAVEGPIHIDLALRRLRTAWGAGRAGNQIRSSFESALLAVSDRGAVKLDRYRFLWPPQMGTPPVRYPSGDPESIRRIEFVAREELDLALLRFIQDARRIEEDDLTFSVARLFGWHRRGPEISQGLDDSVRRLLDSGKVRRDGGYLVAVDDEPISQVSQ